MKLPFLSGDPSWFPHTSLALSEPNGLLAAGGDLAPARLLAAYSMGIFPWYQDGQPILWWTPDPRMVLNPKQCHASKSMVKFLRKTHLKVKIDIQFERVVDACALRNGDTSTWITREMKAAYIDLHEKGFCHSVEVYDGDALVGGLYGVSLGRVFFGESMFSNANNASKMALIVLSRFLRNNQFLLIDCQVASDHLQSLGAFEMSRTQFERYLSEGIEEHALKSTQQLWYSARKRTLSTDGYIAD